MPSIYKEKSRPAAMGENTMVAELINNIIGEELVTSSLRLRGKTLSSVWQLLCSGKHPTS
jgi:hypothetical protein